jgi:hypothetical protein
VPLRALPCISLLLLAGACTAPATSEVPDDVDPTPEPVDYAGCLLPLEESPAWDLVDIALEAGVQDRFARNIGVAAQDFDQDGDLDLFLANGSDPSQLFLAQDDGTFVAQPTPPTSGDDEGVSSVDYDNDGDQDLYLACGSWNGACSNRLFRNDGLDADGRLQFVDVSVSSGIAAFSTPTFGGTWADYDNDGDLDLFQPSKLLPGGGAPPSRDLLFRNEGDGTFTEVAEEAGLAAESDGHPSTWLDYDEDGRPDLFLTVHNGENRLFHNEGDGTFTDQTPDVLRLPMLSFASLAADFNNDGHIDLLVSGRTNPGSGSMGEELHGLFLGDGAGGWTDMSLGTGLNGPGDSATFIPTMGLQALDLDLDGFPEVLFGNGSPDAGAVNAFGSFVPTKDGGLRWIDRTAEIEGAAMDDGEFPAPEAYPYRTHGMAFFDYDGDGDIDLYMGNGGGPFMEPNRLFRNDSELGHHRLSVELRGTESPRDGTGARVRLADGPTGASTWEVYRWALPTSGFNSSQPTRLLIGTGRCPGPYHVEVRWPGGAFQVLEQVSAESDILIVEG